MSIDSTQTIMTGNTMPPNENKINTTSYSALRPWLIWGLVVFFYFYENILQVSTGVMTHELMRDFSINATTMGIIAAFFFFSYAPTQLPVGILVDRFGPRRLVTLAILLVVVGSYVFSHASGVGELQIGRMLIGFGSAFSVVSAFKLAATWFPLERFALLTGLTVTAGLSGSIFGEKQLAILVSQIGWRSSMMWFVYTGIVLAILVWLVVRDHPDHLTTQSESSNNYSASKELFKGLAYVLRNPQSWIVAVYGGLMFAPTSIFGAQWGVYFLTQTHHLAKTEAAGLIGTLFGGWIIGSPLSGYISDRLKRRKPTLLIGSLGALVCMTLVIYVQSLSVTSLSITLFLFGFFSSGFLPSFSIIREISPLAVSATALGFMNLFNMLGGVFGQPLVGYLLDHSWDGTIVDGARIYSIANYHYAMALLPMMICISLFILPFIRETNCHSIDDEQWQARAES